MGDLIDWPVYICVICDDLEAQRTFYRDVLGLNEVAVTETRVRFDVGNFRILELISTSEGNYGSPRFQVSFGVRDVHQAVDELAKRGLRSLDGVRLDPQDNTPYAVFRDAEENYFEVTQLAEVP